MRRRPPPIAPLVALIIAAATPVDGRAAALGEGSELRWTAPPGCPRAEEVESRIERLLGGPLAGRGIEADAEVRSDGDGWSLDLALRRGDVDERRTLSAKRCSALTDALALLLAVLADPVATSASLGVADVVGEVEASDGDGDDDGDDGDVEPPPPDYPGARAGPMAVKNTSPSLSEPVLEDELADADDLAPIPPADRTPLVWSLRIAGGAEVGALSGPSGGLAAAFTVRRKRFQAELSGLYVFPRSRPIDGIEGATIWSRLGVAALRGCALPPVGAVALPLCVGLEAGALEAEGRGLNSGRRPRSPWLAVVFGPSLRWSFARRVGLWAGAELAIPLQAPSFIIEVPGEETDIVAHQPAPITGRFLAGFEFALAGLGRESSRPGDASASRRR